MTVPELIIALFALLIGGLLLPLSSGARMALFLALIVLAVLTLVGGGMHYVIAVLR